jgi:hypothetical protein
MILVGREPTKEREEVMATTKGRVTMTEAYAKRVLQDHPEWVIEDGVIGHPDDIAAEKEAK